MCSGQTPEKRKVYLPAKTRILHHPMNEFQENITTASRDVTFTDFVLKAKEIVAYLLRKWKIIVLAGLIGGAIGFFYASFKKPIYTAKLTYALDDDKGGSPMVGALGLASNFGFDIGSSAGGAFGGGNLIELMHSRWLIEKTLLSEVTVNGKKTSLADYYIEINNLRKGWEGNPELANMHFAVDVDRSTFSRAQDSVLGTIYATVNDELLDISQKDKKISITNVEVNSKYEMLAKVLCEALVKEVSEFYIETKSKKAKFNLIILEKQADSIRRALNGAITGVAVANDNTYNLNPALNVRRAPSAVRQVDVQANTAILTELIKNLELARVTLRKETPLFQVIDRPILPLTKSRVSKLNSLITGAFFAGLLSIFMLVGMRWWKKLSSVQHSTLKQVK